MTTFVQIPASKSSLSRRKTVFGVGVNDASYVVQPTINGTRACCPFYRKWRNMLRRSYSPAYHLKHPTYIDCTVTAEWLMFSVFRRWMIEQDWQGKELDKDILDHGNNIYGPDTCVFVSHAINSLLTDNAASRGKYRQGVDLHKPSGKYKARVRRYGKGKHLGLFTTTEEASTAYLIAKSAHIIEVAQTQQPNVKAGLITIAENMIEERY